MHRPSVSIVMPVRNEAAVIASTLINTLALLGPEDELIVVDGCSSDGTLDILHRHTVDYPALTVLTGHTGRARQMNAGAALARGDVLLFLHADTLLTAMCWRALLLAVHGTQPVWGRFDVRIEGRSRSLPMVAWFMNQRSRLTRVCTGDQALFLTRTLFQTLGGFPEQPLMEDIELSKRLKALGSQATFVPLSTPVFTSGRRWDEQGPWRTIILMWRLRWAYWRGVPADQLAALYREVR